jgi:predicted O-methyltransferase YrrM
VSVEPGSFAFGALDLSGGRQKGRNPREGYSRGWGLQFGGLADRLRSDPVYGEALQLAAGRTIQAEHCRMNLFLIIRYFLKQLPAGDLVEFGSYRGGSAIFMAAVAKATGLESRVWALDTFEGLPGADARIDLHRDGDFSDVDYDELLAYSDRAGLDNLTFVRGKFDQTIGAVFERCPGIALVHIDCDVRSAVAFAYEAAKSNMVDGGYIAFDDAHYSSCLGATEVVEDLVIRRDGKNCEQIYPHFVFRQWADQA